MQTSDSVAERFRAHVVRHRLFSDPGLVLVAVSGGPDSVALLDLMVAQAPMLGLEVVVGHVDHGIAPESVDVAAGVAALAERMGVPHRAARLSLGAGASETVARRARYRELRAMQRRLGARYLVTAHHADDQVETVLLRAFRGSGLAGLAGIPRRGPRGLVRPLLPFSRAELAEWVAQRERELGFPLVVHDDPANRDPRHDRSWLRTAFLPALEERYGAGVRADLLSVAADAARHRSAWRAVLRALPDLEYRRIDGGIEVARAPLLRYDDVLAASVLRALARENRWALGPRRAARVLEFVRRGTSGRAIELGAGRAVELAFDRVRLVASRDRGAACPRNVTDAEGSLEWSGWELRWCVEPARASARLGRVAWITPGEWAVRGPAPGERIVPLGGPGRRAVRRLLMEARVPVGDRVGYPVIVRGRTVLWLPGVCRTAVDVPVVGAPAVRIEVRERRGNTPVP